MLTQLYIRDFVVVSELELTLNKGLSVLTGETGAGKSIIVDALALALGERADPSVIRHGCSRAEIIAGFSLPEGHDALTWLASNGLADGNQCVLRRIIENERPSKAYINGRPTTMQNLKSLGELLVDIHGQHEHQSLMKRDAQRQILDDYAGTSSDVRTLAQLYATLRGLEERLHNLKQQSADQASRIELLRYQVQELETLGLGVDELPALEDEHARLSYATELLEGAQAAVHALYNADDQSINELLLQQIRRLEALEKYDPKLGEIANLLNEASIQISEGASQLNHYLDRLEIDPQRLEWLNDRLTMVHDLSRKHKVEGRELPLVLTKMIQELDDIENAEQNTEKLEQELESTRTHFLELARTISNKRYAAAERLGAEVTAHMQDLGMPGGQFAVLLIGLDDDDYRATGLEIIDFQVSANPGQPLKPLGKVASGGELSRISLALQVVIAGLGRIPTLIFDEVDVGVGGRVAEIVGTRLKTLAESRQVLCITHLAQVAAQGHHHLRVSKISDGKTTNTIITPLPSEQRVHEIARMIGGVEISQQTLAHAEDMLSRAPA